MMICVSQRGYICIWFNPNSGSRLQDLISPVGVSLENNPVCLSVRLVEDCNSLSVRVLRLVTTVSHLFVTSSQAQVELQRNHEKSRRDRQNVIFDRLERILDFFQLYIHLVGCTLDLGYHLYQTQTL